MDEMDGSRIGGDERAADADATIAGTGDAGDGARIITGIAKAGRAAAATASPGLMPRTGNKLVRLAQKTWGKVGNLGSAAGSQVFGVPAARHL